MHSALFAFSISHYLNNSKSKRLLQVCSCNVCPFEARGQADELLLFHHASTTCQHLWTECRRKGTLVLARVIAAWVNILIGLEVPDQSGSVELRDRPNGDLCAFNCVRAPFGRSPVDPFPTQSTIPGPHPGVAPIEISTSTRVKPPTT